MTTTIVDVQQIARHGANHRSGERTGTETSDVSDYLNAKSVEIDRAIGLQRMNIIKRDLLLHVSISWTPVIQSLSEKK